MNKTNLILLFVVVLVAGAIGGYSLGMSGGHDTAYLKDTANMMSDDAKMMTEMSEMMSKDGMMMTELGAKYNNADLTAEAKVAAEKSKKLSEMGVEMVKRSNELLKMIE